MNNKFLTIREKIMNLLLESENPLSITEIAHYLDIPLKDKKIIYDALTHIAKTIRRKTHHNYQLVMIPPICKNCGYVFKELDKPKKPSKCPRCRSERIIEPRFKIIGK